MPRHAATPATAAQPPSPLDDEGEPCARGDWCTSPDALTRWHDGRRIVEPPLGPRTFCEEDYREIRDALTGFPARHVDLHARRIEPRSDSYWGRRGQQVAPAMPIRGDVDALMGSMVDITCAWHDQVAALPRSGIWPCTEPDPRMRERYGTEILTRAVGELASRLGSLLSLEPRPMGRTIPSRRLVDPDLPGDAIVVRVEGDLAMVRQRMGGREAGLEILALHWQALRALEVTPPRPDYLDGVKCYKCRYVSLVRAGMPDSPDEPEWYSSCVRRSCGHRMTEAEYRRHVTRLHALAGGRVVTEALELAGEPEGPAVAPGALAC